MLNSLVFLVFGIYIGQNCPQIYSVKDIVIKIIQAIDNKSKEQSYFDILSKFFKK